MSESIQTKGKTVSDAVSEALLQLGLRRDEVEIKVLEEPKAGLLGFIGTRAAKVMVRKKPESSRNRGRGRDHRSKDDQSHSLSGGSRGGRTRGGRGRGGRNNDNRNENNNRQDGNRPDNNRQGGNRPDNNRQGGNRPDNNRPVSNRPDNNRPDNSRRDNNRQEASSRDDNRGGRSRGGRGGRGGARSDNRNEGRNDNRNDNRNSSRNESRSNARNQPRDEAAGRHRDDVRVDTPKVSPNDNQGETRNEARNDDRSSNRNSNRNEGRGGSRSRRSRRVNPPENQQENLNAGPVEQNDKQGREDQNESRGTRRGSRGGRGRGRDDQRRDEPTTNNAEAVRQPAAEVVSEAPNTRENTSMTDDQNKPAPVETPQVEAAAPAAVTPEAPAPVTKPKRKGWGGGLGSRLASKKNPQAKARKPVRVVGESPAPSAAAPTSSREPRRESRDDNRGRSDYRERRPAASAEEVIISGVPASKYAKAVADVTVDNLDPALVELTSGMLARAGFPCEVQVNDGEYRQVRISTDDEDAGMLIGRHGQTVDAVEHLVERMASNAIDDRARMNLDINEYRLRREESLADRVTEAIAEVRETGKPYHVESMDARERRLVHLEAEPVEGIRTYTMIGHGGKHVVIALDEEADEGNQNED